MRLQPPPCLTEQNPDKREFKKKCQRVLIATSKSSENQAINKIGENRTIIFGIVILTDI
jgi:hypothetical protein